MLGVTDGSCCWVGVGVSGSELPAVAEILFLNRNANQSGEFSKKKLERK